MYVYTYIYDSQIAISLFTSVIKLISSCDRKGRVCKILTSMIRIFLYRSLESWTQHPQHCSSTTESWCHISPLCLLQGRKLVTKPRGDAAPRGPEGPGICKGTRLSAPLRTREVTLSISKDYPLGKLRQAGGGWVGSSGRPPRGRGPSPPRPCPALCAPPARAPSRGSGLRKCRAARARA